MSEENALVIVAGYQDLDAARRDFDTLTEGAKAKRIPLRGAVLVGKDAGGTPVVVDTGNRLGRRGAAWGAGAGLAVGLFSPALLASAAVGAAAGALAGTFANHRVKSGLADKIGEALAAGSAVIISVVAPEGRLAAEQAMAASPMKSVAELSHKTLRSLGAALARLDEPEPAEPAPTATVDTEMAVDPLLTGVAWSWLTEALDSGEVQRRAESATVTRTTSESFGALDAQPPVGDVEMRASWTPIDTELRHHLIAWTVLLATMAGLPPLPDTVSRFPVSGPFGPTR